MALQPCIEKCARLVCSGIMSEPALLSIRDYQASDASSCAQLLYEFVHRGTQGSYDVQQWRAWAPIR
ncbi:MAG: hypothetical protein NPIRA03_31960 [Nitrospirales bacterium]|nr:MAG: hypothetical protein NPIRA03_31960 [Nitrospirales bacterium]